MATKFNKEIWLNFEKTGKQSNTSSLEVLAEPAPTNINTIYDRALEANIVTEPIDIVSVVREIFNITLYFNDLDRNISGFIERIGPQNWAIHVNKWENPRRQKFTIAHELAHFILHKNILLAGSHYDNVLYRDENTSQVEREANSFASELLMPREKFEQYINEGYNTIDLLASKFELSTSAVRYRAYKLNYIGEY